MGITSREPGTVRGTAKKTTLFFFLLTSYDARAVVTVVTKLPVTCWRGSEEASW